MANLCHPAGKGQFCLNGGMPGSLRAIECLIHRLRVQREVRRARVLMLGAQNESIDSFDYKDGVPGPKN